METENAVAAAAQAPPSVAAGPTLPPKKEHHTTVILRTPLETAPPYVERNTISLVVVATRHVRTPSRSRLHDDQFAAVVQQAYRPRDAAAVLCQGMLLGCGSCAVYPTRALSRGVLGVGSAMVIISSSCIGNNSHLNVVVTFSSVRRSVVKLGELVT